LRSDFGRGIVGAIWAAADTLLLFSDRTIDLLRNDNFQRAFEEIQIIDKKSQRQSLIRNPPQERLWHFILECREKGVPVRAIILKARQMGFSTFIICLFLLIIVWKPLTNAFSASFEDISAIKLLAKAHFAWEHLPPELKLSKTLKTDTKHEIAFDAPHYSQFICTTAKNAFLASSQTNQLLHLSEVAKWPRTTAHDTWVSITHTVATNDPESMIFAESTAWGLNFFKDIWDGAKAGKNPYKPFFASWIGFPEYFIFFPKGHKPKFSPEALQLQKDSKACDEQIAWAQAVCDEKCLGDWPKFHQDNPYSEEVAFLSTGHKWFTHDGIKQMMLQVMDPVCTGNVKWGHNSKPIVKFTEDPYGIIEVWRHPQKDRAYVWSADICAGIGGDYFVLNIWLVPRPDSLTDCLEQVAKVRSNRIGSSRAAQIIFQLAVYYNWAFGANEVNNMGIDTAHDLERGTPNTQTEGGYPHLYYYTRVDTKTDEHTKIVGWNTTTITRNYMMQRLQTAVNEYSIVIHSNRTALELEGFGHDPQTDDYVSEYRDDITGVRHDDEVFCAAIGWQMFEKRPKTLNRRYE